MGKDPRESLLFTENKDFTWILTSKTLPMLRLDKKIQIELHVAYYRNLII
jgi:hypothetical protein